MTTSKYILDTKAKLQNVIKTITNPEIKYLSFDTETNGLKLYETVIIGISIAISKKVGYYLPLLEWIPDPNSQKLKTIDKVPRLVFENGQFKDHWRDNIFYPEDVTPRQYQPPQFIIDFLKIITNKKQLIMHNAPFDINQVYINMGIDLSPRLWADTVLMAHIIDENTPNGLKDVATQYKDELGINPYVLANQEQVELGETVIVNGGLFTGKRKHVWRAAADKLAKYAIADATLTYGIYEVALKKFIADFGKEKLKWFFQDEVMPLCREVVIPMARNGVHIDVPFFEKLKIETQTKLESLNDEIIQILEPHLKGFNIGKSREEVVSKGKLIRKIMELENLPIPTKFDKKTQTLKETLAKAEVKKAYNTNPHWAYAYILGEDEIRYPKEKLEQIKDDIYYEATGKKHHFNINSSAHLTWLFCDRLGYDRADFPQTDSATKDNPIPSMSAEVIEEQLLGEFPWVKKLLLWKKLNKMQTTYIEPALNLVQDEYLYMNIKQHGTVSGRFAIGGGFNLQTLPAAEEYENCIKCHSKNITKIHKIELLFDCECKDCGYIDQDVYSPSAIKKGFIAPQGKKIVAADFCLHPDTEILTKRGWIPILKVKELDDVWQVSPQTLLGSWTKPTRIVKREYCGDMFEFGNERGTLKVTENHTMLWAESNPLSTKIALSQELIPIWHRNIILNSNNLPRHFGSILKQFNYIESCAKTEELTCKSMDEGLIDSTQIAYVQHGFEARKVRDGKYYKLIIRDSQTLELGLNDVRVTSFYGTVGCVTVPDGFILVRHKGQTFVTGNCALEPRLFAFNSNDPKLKQIYYDDLDFYSKIGCDMENQPYRNLKKTGQSSDMRLRSVIKTIALAIPYGARDYQIGRLLDLKTSFVDKQGEIQTRVDTKAAHEVVTKYLNTYPGLAAYMDQCDIECTTKGYVQTIVGRKRHFKYAPAIFDILSAKNIGITEFLDAPKDKLTEKLGLNTKDLEYVIDTVGLKKATVLEKGGWAYLKGFFKNELNNSKNFKIQGLAAHITNKAMIEITREFAKQKLNAQIVLQVHDEIIVYCDDGIEEQVKQIVQDKMENNDYTKLVDLPILAEPKIANNLKDAK